METVTIVVTTVDAGTVYTSPPVVVAGTERWQDSYAYSLSGQD